MKTERAIHGVFREDEIHWVGDGFRVATYFPSPKIGARLNPFLLMDYHPPYAYSPTKKARGVGSHPHRGFETVSIAFEGSVAHQDSHGGGGVIGPGDVQWMTAGGGVLHKEYHEAAFAERGGTMHMMQLWVNLPKASKMTAPAYQAITASQMGETPLPNGGGVVRVIAGEYEGAKGPATTFTRIQLWMIQMNPGGRMEITLPATDNAGLMVLHGAVTVNCSQAAGDHELVVFENKGETITIEATAPSRLVFLGGEPIAEPVVQYGPFVMNTEQEIKQAIWDFNSGKFGYLD